MLRTLSFVLGLCLVGFISESRAAIDDGLIGYWPLDGDALDHSGNGNDGTVLTGASFVANPTGEGQVLQNAVGAYDTGHVYVGLSDSYRPDNLEVGYTGSGALWVMFDDRESMLIDEGWQGVLGNPPGILYVARRMGAVDQIWTMVRRVERTGSNKNYWPRTPNHSVGRENVWYHIAWTFHSHHQGDEGHFRWYVNGELVAEYTDGAQTIKSSEFRIGTSQQGYASNTKIAEVRLYDRILSEDEVWQLARQEGFSPLANYPAWWERYGVIDPQKYPDNYAPINQGQLKHMATQAANYMDDELEALGGAGTNVHGLVDAWSEPTSQTNGYAMVNQGQLKHVASFFYDRLGELNFSDWPEEMIIDENTGYPWTQTVEDDANYAPVNLGQLKYVFSFSLEDWSWIQDNDEDGMRDGWEQSIVDSGLEDQNGDGTVDIWDVLPGDDFDGDFLTNLMEWERSSDPVVAEVTLPATPDDTNYLPGYVLWDGWEGVSGDNLASMDNYANWPTYPDERTLTSGLAYSSDSSVNAANLLRGYITVPQAGDYTFYVSGDSNVELYMSPNEQPFDLECVAMVSEASTAEQSWDENDEQHSHALSLEAGQKYYFELRHKADSDPGAHFAVAWESDAIARELVPVSALSPPPYLPMIYAGGDVLMLAEELPYSLQAYVYGGIGEGVETYVDLSQADYSWSLVDFDGDSEKVLIEFPQGGVSNLDIGESGTAEFLLNVNFPDTTNPDTGMSLSFSDTISIEVMESNVATDGLVAHWSFDEGNMLKTYDSSGSGIDMKVYGAIKGDGVIGDCYTFMDSDFLQTNSTSALEISGELTISVWIKVSDSNLDQYMRIVSKKKKYDASRGYELEYNPADNRLTFGGVGAQQYLAYGVDFAKGEWHHVAFTLSRGEYGNTYLAAFYVDGVQVSDESAGYTQGGDGGWIPGRRNMYPVRIDATPLAIGRQSDVGYTNVKEQYFLGSIDEVRIHNLALPADVIARLAKDRGGLLLECKASDIVADNGDSVIQWEDGTGRTDESGNLYSLVSSGDSAPTLAFVDDEPVVRFDGVDDFMTPEQSLSADAGDNTFVMVASINNLGDANTRTIFSSSTAANVQDDEAWRLDAVPGLDQIKLQAGGQSYYGLGSGNDAQVIIVKLSNGDDGVNRHVEIYQDGMLVVDELITDSDTSTASIVSKVVLGGDYQYTNNTQMDVYELRVYGRAISDAEVAEVNEELYSRYILERSSTVVLASPREDIELVVTDPETDVLDVELAARIDEGDPVAWVEFIDVNTMSVVSSATVAPYRTVWSGVQPGTYEICAIAYDITGAVLGRSHGSTMNVTEVGHGYMIANLDKGEAAYGVSDYVEDGSIYICGSSDGYPMVWGEGRAVKLTMPEGNKSGEANAVNTAGNVVGWVNSGSGSDQSAVFWTYSNGSWTGQVPREFSNYRESAIRDINNGNVAVGYYYVETEYSTGDLIVDYVPFSYDVAGRMFTSLYNRPEGLDMAQAIGSSGTVVGRGKMIIPSYVPGNRTPPIRTPAHRPFLYSLKNRAEYGPNHFLANWPKFCENAPSAFTESYVQGHRNWWPALHRGEGLDVDDTGGIWAGYSFFYHYLGTYKGRWWHPYARHAAYGSLSATSNPPIPVKGTGSSFYALGGFSSEARAVESIDGDVHVVGWSYTGVGNKLDSSLWYGVTSPLTVQRAIDANPSRPIPWALTSEERHGFMWIVGSDTVTDLNDLVVSDSWEIISANDINNVGWIVGEGALDGRVAAFVMAEAADSDHDFLSDLTEAFSTGGDIDDTNSDVDGDDSVLTTDWNSRRNSYDDLLEALYGTNPRFEDTDGDGLPDYWEVYYSLDPLDDGVNGPDDGNAIAYYGADGDPDKDGLTNVEEFAYDTSPVDPDTDGDGMPDGWEVQYVFDPVDQLDAENDTITDDNATADWDGDGLVNVDEYRYGANPTLVNSDYEIDVANIQALTVGTPPVAVPVPGKGQEVFDYSSGYPYLDPRTESDDYPLGYIPYRDPDYASLNDQIVFGEDGLPVPNAAINPGFYYFDESTATAYVDTYYPEQYFDSKSFTYKAYEYSGGTQRPIPEDEDPRELTEYVALEVAGDAVLDKDDLPVSVRRLKFVPGLGTLVWDMYSAGIVTGSAGLNDRQEILRALVPSSVTDTLWSSIRLEGLAIWNEYILVSGNSADLDEDYLPDALEDSVFLGTISGERDSDDDGMPDGYEIVHGLDPLNSIQDELALDNDSDGLSNREEYDLGLLPNHWDTDGDGIADGREIETLTDGGAIALSPAGLMDGLVVWWTFDDWSDPRVYDRSLMLSTQGEGVHNYNDGFLHGSMTVNDRSTGPEPGHLGYLITNVSSHSSGFLSSPLECESYFAVPDDLDFDLSQGSQSSFSLSFWYKWSADGTGSLVPGIKGKLFAQERLVMKKSGAYRMTLEPDNQTLTFTASTSNGDVLISSAAVEPDLWHYIAVVYDQTSEVLQLIVRSQLDSPDGGFVVASEMLVSEKSITGGLSILPSAEPFMLGSPRSVPSACHDAAFDDFRIYQKALSEIELSMLSDPNHQDRDSNVDRDGDGMTELVEDEWGTKSYEADSDADGISDSLEAFGYRYTAEDGFIADVGGYDANPRTGWKSSPTHADSDGDGIRDDVEVIGYLVSVQLVGESSSTTYTVITDPLLSDSDSDGLKDKEEYELYRTNPVFEDTDEDGMPDGFEVKYGLNPLDPADALADLDGDGVNNVDEYLDDGRHIAYNEEELERYKDSDGDGLTDIVENEMGSDPNNIDTDGDGMLDGFEYVNGFDLLDNLHPENDTYTADNADGDYDGDGILNVDEQNDDISTVSKGGLLSPDSTQLSSRYILQIYQCAMVGNGVIGVAPTLGSVDELYFPVPHDANGNPLPAAPWEISMTGDYATDGMFANAGRIRFFGKLRTDIDDFVLDSRFRVVDGYVVWEFSGNRGSFESFWSYDPADPSSIHSEDRPFYYEPLSTTAFLNSLERDEDGCVRFSTVFEPSSRCGVPPEDDMTPLPDSLPLGTDEGATTLAGNAGGGSALLLSRSNYTKDNPAGGGGGGGDSPFPYDILAFTATYMVKQEVLVFQTSDYDMDGVPDYADGMDRFSGDGTTTSAPQVAELHPLVIDLSAFPAAAFGRLKLRVNYEGSDPSSDVDRTVDEDSVSFSLNSTAKRLRVWMQGSDVTRQTASVQDGGDYVEGEYLYTAAELGLSVENPSITLWVEPLKSSVNMKPEIVEVQITTDETPVLLAANAFRTVGMYNYIPLEIGVAVDADRSGTIYDPGIVFSGDDSTSEGSPYLFWINNDSDFGSDDEAEDHEPLVADSIDGHIDNTRDLEDFSRLWIDVKGIKNGLKDGSIRLGLSWRNVVEGTPSIKLYPAVEDDGGVRYLFESSVADLQAAASDALYPSSDAIWLGSSRGDFEGRDAVTAGGDVYFQEDFWSGFEGNVVHLLFEAERVGKGELKVIMQLKVDGGYSNIELSTNGVWFDFKDIKKLYQHFTVGDDTDMNPVTSAEEINEVSDEDFDALGFEDDYILFVHGWRMKKWERRYFAETAFKRLYWQGYRGRFGLFSWPTEYVDGMINQILDSENYMRSDYKARRSSEGLVGVIDDLMTQYNGKLRVIAHSMGNVVSSEALRQGAVVHTYVASQAASIARAYDADGPEHLTLERIYGALVGNSDVDFGIISDKLLVDHPDVFANYPETGDVYYKGIGYDSFIVNYHNREDWALSVWLVAQALKPNSEYALTDEHWYTGHHEYIDPYNPEYGIKFVADRELVFPDDRFEIFARAARANSVPLGASVADGFATRGEISYGYDLNEKYGFGHGGEDHSAQFRSTIQCRWEYWNELLLDFGINQ